ncbi:MAG: gamma-glutamylcyclotransferase, partial [Myxococcales bacterium]|nr:gamma-glutamylcyclotransferase [Myxococcales bacterium]
MPVVFVYGTLRRGEVSHHLLRGARFVDTTRTAPCFTLYQIDWYPALVARGQTSVVGELYVVDEALLARLDEYEGCPESYARPLIPLVCSRAAEGYVMP